MEEVDEFGIPIKKPNQKKQSVDEFGIPIKKKDGTGAPTSTTTTKTDKKEIVPKKKKLESSPDGIKFNEWKDSPKKKKVQASYEKIKNEINAFAEMEAIVTSVTFQFPTTNPSSPKWLVVKINGENYMMQFIPNDFEKLNSLKVNDKIIIKSRSAGFSNNHPYLILSSNYIEHNNKVLFERDLTKNDGC